MTVYFNGGELGTPMTATEIVARRAEELERIRRGFDAAAAIYLRPAWEAVMAVSGVGLPFARERNAEKDPKQMCRAGEHGRCGGVDCGCWCHRERLDK